jgi:phage regulator Rha-like protein
MTSQEIADLLGNRHDKVMQSIERLVDRDVIHSPPLGEKSNSLGRPGKEYVFQGEQGKRDSIIVVAQLSPEFTAVLVDRWVELEAALAEPARQST